MIRIDDIRRDAKWLNLSIAQLALASGVRASTISKLFSGRRALTLPIARRLRDAINAVRRERQADSSISFAKKVPVQSAGGEDADTLRAIPLGIDDALEVVTQEMPGVGVNLFDESSRKVRPGGKVSVENSRYAVAEEGDWSCMVSGPAWDTVINQLRRHYAARSNQADQTPAKPASGQSAGADRTGR